MAHTQAAEARVANEDLDEDDLDGMPVTSFDALGGAARALPAVPVRPPSTAVVRGPPHTTALHAPPALQSPALHTAQQQWQPPPPLPHAAAAAAAIDLCSDDDDDVVMAAAAAAATADGAAPLLPLEGWKLQDGPYVVTLRSDTCWVGAHRRRRGRRACHRQQPQGPPPRRGCAGRKKYSACRIAFYHDGCARPHATQQWNLRPRQRLLPTRR